MRFAMIFTASAAAASILPGKRDASVCTEIRPRVPWTNLTSGEKSAYIQADLCLINAPSKSGFPGAVTRWDDLQWPHVVQSATVHNVGAFLPFHRYYMTAHERLIKDECGYTGRMPYWDELADQENMSSSEMWSTEYFGGNGTAENYCVVDGPFANLTLRWLADGSIEDHCLTRIMNDNSLSRTSQEEIDACNAITNYTSAWECFNGGPHGGGHAAVGGIMLDGTLSPGDPVFYLHHSWLDKLFWDWQKLDLPARLADIGGPNIPASRGTQPGGPDGPNGTAVRSGTGVPENPSGVIGGTGSEFVDYFGDNGTVTTLNHRIYMAEIYPNVTIGDLMDLNGAVICSEYIDV
ncbi:hypothetical protein JX265_005085 [Neoarthrinium moseri]|uniref:Tyrosinase copper-binding domain-containing protein n=2 Tax=Neoarthrinium moseri TaxID=1658444 RepID=A0A9P9WPJ5_9PEZI|nr:hypothetical protein JX265_005085 [Neoarthrinium moseri]